MAGTIVADTLTHSTAGSIATNYVVDGSAKYWVDFNGTGTVAVRDSLNHASLVDNGTGDYTVTVSSAFGNANYSCAGSSQQSSNGGRGDFFLGLNQETQTTTVRRISTCDSNGNATDSLIGNLQIWGDLA